MVAIDVHTDAAEGRFPFRNFVLHPVGFTAIAGTLVTLTAIAADGFGENGLRLGSEIAWRFSMVVFVFALAAGPICRLVPLESCRALEKHARQLTWSFCAAVGIYLATLLVPNAIRPPSIDHAGLGAGMVLFVLFCGAQAAMMAFAQTPQARRLLGDKGRRAILSVASIYFWITYALTALAHISGPHRPDIFYGPSLFLLVVALLLCFADRFVMKWKGAELPLSSEPAR